MNYNNFERDTLRIYTVDAFTNEPLKGNPAGVCLLDEKVDKMEWSEPCVITVYEFAQI